MSVYAAADISVAMNQVLASIASLIVADGILVHDRKKGVVIHTTVQGIFNLKFANELSAAVHEVIIDHAISAEKMSAGGFDAFLRVLLGMFGYGDRYNFTESQSQVNVGNPEAMLADRPTERDVTDLVNKYCIKDELVGDILKRAIALAGRGGRIVVEKSTNHLSVVELTCGHTFNFATTICGVTNLVLEKPRTTCIDGFIEEVSEINTLLTDASESKEALILFARGMSDDVMNTLKVNYDRGTLKVIPVIVGSEVTDLNVLNDISAVCGCDVLNTHSGRLMNSIRLHECAYIERAAIFNGRLTITNRKNSERVNTQVKFLHSKRDAQKSTDIQTIIDSRIRSLTPNHVIIRLPDDHLYVKRAQAVDYSLRALNSLVQYGSITVNGKKMLASTAVAAELHSRLCSETLKSLGAAVIVNQQSP